MNRRQDFLAQDFLADEACFQAVSSPLVHLELRRKVVTGDAPYAQRRLNWRLLQQGGDYFGALKDIHSSLGK